MTVRIPKLALVAAGAVVVGVLAATAFGAFDSDSATTTTVAGAFARPDPAALRQQLERFQQCLNQHGIKQPRSPQGRPHRPSKKARRAFEACRRYLPHGARGAPPLGVVPGAPPGFQGAPPGGFPGGYPGVPSG